MDVFTSITLNYLPKARILASTVKRLHPEWRFHVCISDERPSADLDTTAEPFDNVIWIEDLPIDNLYGWIFKHSLVELCTAVKGPVTRQLVTQGVEKILFLDPDIAVFNSLSEVEDLLDEHSIILTPHISHVEEDRGAIIDNEIGALRWGTYNLGFIAIRNDAEGKRFADWWNQRLLEFCYDDTPYGLFTDQRWCNLVPVFFDNVRVLRDPAYNVASWNLSTREVTLSGDGVILVNGSPLKFFHFTGYDSGAGRVMTTKYAGDNTLVHEIWTWYRLQLEKYGQKEAERRRWPFDYFNNGERIPHEARVLYRERKDLQIAHSNPFEITADGGFYGWFVANG